MGMRKIDRNKILTTVVLSIILGAGSGVLATALTSSYLSDYAIQLSELTTPLRIAKDAPRAFPDDINEAISQINGVIDKSIASAFINSTKGQNGFTAKDLVVSGVVVTSDGWLMFPKPNNINAKNCTIILNNKTYTPKEVINNELYGVVFIKIDASSLSVVAFGDALKMSLADQVFVLDGYENFSIHSVTDVGNLYGTVVSSDVLQKRIKIDISDTSFSPVFNLSSQFIGVTNSLEEGIVPIEVLFSDFSSLLANDKIIRPSLGVNTLSLAHTIDFSDKNYSEYKVGALIYGAGVKRYSVAESVGLKKGDIILSIDGQGINKLNTLDQYIVMHKPGDKIELIVDRDGEEKIFSIELGTK